ncbi:Bromodomain-containing protein, partial [Diaporthe sp. PMI_573]
PFKEPVDPIIDNVPDYFEKVTKAMDLHTIMKTKMDQELYTNDEEFLADMNQIFANCKTY